MFLSTILDYKDNLFDQLSRSANFENIANGRQGAVLLHNKDNLIPIVRTTTNYENPASYFLPIHLNIIDDIRTKFHSILSDGILDFNNALIEIYDNNYRTMGYHSDQALDLADNSYICIFSCYESPNNTTSLRELKIQNKRTKQSYDIILHHNSLILFSTSINKEYRHKIILSERGSNEQNKWLGITFRLSKRLIRFIDNIPYLTNDVKLVLANESERKLFYKYRRLENSNTDYDYPDLNYTISNSDLIMPIII